MQGTIESVRDAKSGKSLQVTVNGQRFYSKKFELRNMVGRTVNFEPSRQNFDDGGGIDWINDFSVLESGSYTHTDPGPAHAGAYQSENPAPPGIGDPGYDKTMREKRDLGPYLPFTSNMCAHLIQAGNIKTAEDLRNWADNSMAAIIHAVDQNS